MNKIDHMIFVFTCPRSYSSLLTKCIHSCDAFVGDCSKNEIRKPLGHYENNAIFVTCFRKYVNQHDNSAYRAFMEDEYLKDNNIPFSVDDELSTSEGLVLKGNGRPDQIRVAYRGSKINNLGDWISNAQVAVGSEDKAFLRFACDIIF